MKRYFMIVMVMIALFGCARVRVEAPKEAIKLDISMRLDIYQHVSKDIDAIEDMVSGNSAKPSSGKKGSMLDILVKEAYAEESFGPAVEKAAMARKDRKGELLLLEEKGIVGESRLGFAEVRDMGEADQPTRDLVIAENIDRKIIYNALADKNNISIEEVQKMYAKKLQDSAIPGTLIEILNESTGQYEWKVK